MTNKERAEVVELLRCTADECETSKDLDAGIYGTAHHLGLGTWDEAPFASDLIWRIACDARNAVHANGVWWGYAHECLEAALRVEEGSWPVQPAPLPVARVVRGGGRR